MQYTDVSFLTVTYFALVPPSAGTGCLGALPHLTMSLVNLLCGKMEAQSFCTVFYDSLVRHDFCRAAAPFSAVLSGSSAILSFHAESLMVLRCRGIFFRPQDAFLISWRF